MHLPPISRGPDSSLLRVRALAFPSGCGWLPRLLTLAVHPLGLQHESRNGRGALCEVTRDKLSLAVATLQVLDNVPRPPRRQGYAGVACCTALRAVDLGSVGVLQEGVGSR